MTTTGSDDRPRDPSLIGVMAVATILFALDGLVVNVVFFSILPVVIELLVLLPLSFLKRYKPLRRHRLKSIGVFLGALALVIVMVNVNARIAPLRAQRLIDAIESYRAATGDYPQKLDDLVPKFIDGVPRAQYTLGGEFFYLRLAPTEPPTLRYNPHGMDHCIYFFKDKRWTYMG